jgi:hypothetical protein
MDVVHLVLCVADEVAIACALAARNRNVVTASVTPT